MNDWQPIETYEPGSIWDPLIVELMSEDFGLHDIGSYGWDDEIVHGDGDISFACAWHKEGTLDYLGFAPTHWRPLQQDEAE